MSQDKPANVAASVRQQLLSIIRQTGDEANLVWRHYATERLLYRLSVSEYAGNFILKGAMLFMAWTGQSYRPTVDMDLLSYGVASSERLVGVFRDVCVLEVEPDGLEFNAESVKATPIREELAYQGQRVTLTATLGKSRISVQVDVGFGDVVTPRARLIRFPTLLDFPAPRIRAYPRETVVAEKLQAIVVLGIVNSRMKDFYDLYVLARDFAFDGATLTAAIKATFKRRKTEVPHGTPLALREEFGRDDLKSVQWKAFVRKAGLQKDVPELQKVLLDLRKFLLSPLKAASEQDQIPKSWSAGGPWVHAESEIGNT